MASEMGAISSFLSRRGGKSDLEYVQTIVEIFPQQLVPDGIFGNFVSGGNDANFDGQIGLAAQPPYLSVFQNAQQFRLRADRHIADFIQKNRSVVSLLEATDVALQSACECAFLVAKKFALDRESR